ncbi:MAG: hypothetical protein IT203_01265 [Fimbriimonadaceae bacterium]|nr:hypothetical protein [Fimbriimonadaceae bacterium]
MMFVLGLAATIFPRHGIAQSSQRSVLFPLAIQGTMKTIGPETKFTIVFRNVGSEPVESVCIQEAGLYILSRRFNPPYEIRRIAPGKQFSVTAWARGNVFPTPDACLVGVHASYRYLGKTIWLFLKSPRDRQSGG